MKKAARLLLLSSIWFALVSSAAAAEQPTNPVAPAQGYSLYKSLPLSGQITGIAHMLCFNGICSTTRTTEELAGTTGTVDVWQDSRITPAMRSRFWGKGGKIAFAGQAANPAIIALHDASGAVRATLDLDKPLADLEPLLTGASPPPYLLSVDWPLGGSAVIDRAILNVDVDKHQMAVATFLGPTSVRAQLPTLETVTAPVPGPKMLVTFGSNFVIETNAADYTARIAQIICTPSSYIDYKTRGSVPINLTTRTEFKLYGDIWQRRAQLDFNNCDYHGAGALAPIHQSGSSISQGVTILGSTQVVQP